jgi:hypothetical protein
MNIFALRPFAHKKSITEHQWRLVAKISGGDAQENFSLCFKIV